MMYLYCLYWKKLRCLINQQITMNPVFLQRSILQKSCCTWAWCVPAVCVGISGELYKKPHASKLETIWDADHVPRSPKTLAAFMLGHSLNILAWCWFYEKRKYGNGSVVCSRFCVCGECWFCELIDIEHGWDWTGLNQEGFGGKCVKGTTSQIPQYEPDNLVIAKA